MKRKFTLLIMALSIVAASMAQNRSSCSASKPTPDAKLLSQSRQGNFKVCRYLVQNRNQNNDEFSVRYQVNLARLISTYDRNADELRGLNNFMSNLMQDTLKKITMVKVTGYASPDGPASLNERLSMERAVNFKEYLDQNYHIGKYPNTVEAVAQPWSAATKLISESSIPNKTKVLELVNSDQSASAVEAKLRQMPAAWNYMKSNILPTMRCVELVVKYNAWHVVETRERVGMETQVPTTTTSNYVVVLVEDAMGGTLLTMPNSALDFDEDKVRMKLKDKRREAKFKERSRWGREREKIRKRSGIFGRR